MIQPYSGPKTFDALVARMATHLRTEGFDVITDVDVQAMLKRDLGIDSDRCRILGARDVRRATAGAPQLCNVVVRETAEHGVEVNVMDPEAIRRGATPSPQSAAARVHRTLAGVLSQLGASRSTGTHLEI